MSIARLIIMGLLPSGVRLSGPGLSDSRTGNSPDSTVQGANKDLAVPVIAGLIYLDNGSHALVNHFICHRPDHHPLS